METLETSRKFNVWRDSLLQNGIQLNGVSELHTIRKKNGEILFTLLHTDAHTPEGRPLLPVVLLRGHFVSVLTIFREAETGHKYILLVKQRRPATGDWFYEHPSGMMDSEADPFVTAIKEVHEETGYTVRREELTLLIPDLLFSSPGLLDEAGYYFVYETTLPAAEIKLWHDREGGVAGEAEFVMTHVCPYEEGFSLIRNANGLLNMFLYEKYGHRG